MTPGVNGVRRENDGPFGGSLPARGEPRPIRVVHYIPGFLYGGIETQFLGWYRRLDSGQARIHLLLRTQDDGAPALAQFRVLGGEYTRLPRPGAGGLMRYIREVRRFFAGHRDIDILHAHGKDPVVLFYALRHGIRCRILHTHTTREHAGERYRGLKLMLGGFAMRLATHHLACSRSAAVSRYGEKAVQAGRVRIFPNAIEAEAFRFDAAARDALRRELGVGDSFVFGHVGRFTYAKNHAFLLRAFARALSRRPDAVLLLAGDGPLEGGIKALAEELGIGQGVRFLGERADITELMSAMDAFLLPSVFEGMPVTLLEAQASGLPCLVSEGIPPEAKITGLVKTLPLSAGEDAWADSALSLAEAGEREDWAGEVVQAGADFGTTAARLLALYRSLLEEAR